MAESMHQFLERVSLFKEFDEEELSFFIRGMNRINFQRGEIICKEGDSADSMYIIREGVVEVITTSYLGGEVTIARLGEGLAMGEMALVDSDTRSATLKAETEVVLYEITRWDFEDLLEGMSPTYHKLLDQIAHIACDRIRDVNSQIQHYMQYPSELFATEVKTGTESVLNKKVAGLINFFKSR